MATKTIPQLPAAISAQSTDLFEIDESGTSKNLSAAQLQTLYQTGVINASNAAAGTIGEFVQSLIASAGAVTIGSATNVTSISLTAGDWDVEGNVVFKIAGGETISLLTAGISPTTATLPADGSESFDAITATGSPRNQGVALVRKRINIATTTSIFLVAGATATPSSVTAYGVINARRIR